MQLERSRAEEIENKAFEVLDETEIEEPVIDAVQIARNAGYEVKEIDMPQNFENVAGFYSEKEKTIYVAKSDNPRRKLFTVAHELGHIFLGHKNYDVLLRIPKPDQSYTRPESEANLFAANLLMPEFIVREYMQKYNLTRLDYVKLAEIFGVPISAMKSQLEHIH